MTNKDDSYGTTFREGLKKSMERPFKAQNRRERADAGFVIFILCTAFLGLFLMILGVFR